MLNFAVSKIETLSHRGHVSKLYALPDSLLPNYSTRVFCFSARGNYSHTLVMQMMLLDMNKRNVTLSILCVCEAC